MRLAGSVEEEATFIPDMEQPKVFRTARIWLAIFGLVASACLTAHSILPAMYVGLPPLYGSWLQLVFGLTQHAGLDEDVLDHRLNSRTVTMNPIFRFLYWNMNYHIEHHMFPMVPYHALPKLHEIIKADCPPPYPSLFAAYREIIPAVLRQVKDPTYFVRRQFRYPPNRSTRLLWRLSEHGQPYPTRGERRVSRRSWKSHRGNYWSWRRR